MNLGKIAKQVLSTVAPLAATAIGGPFAPMALGILKSVLGTSEESEIEKQLVNASPETLAKLRQGEQDFKLKMRELGIQEQDLYVKDVQHARDFSVKTGIAPQLVLAGLFIGGYFLILISILSGYISPAEGVKDMALILLGVLAGEVPRIMSFFFGSSKSSQDKNVYLAAAQSINGKT